jgi:hypothetical protein
MTLLFILIGWFIISALWGFIPLVEPLRLAALASSGRRKVTASASALLAFVTGVLILLWVSTYTMLSISVYESHADSLLLQDITQTQVSANILPAANEILLRQLSLGSACQGPDQVMCALADRALLYGSPLNMLPVIAAASLIPALAAAFLCWKLTDGPRPALPDVL